jgi:hypothetical protein
VLRDYLTEHLARVERADSERCFGSTGEAPFDGRKLQARTAKAWRKAELDLRPPDCRAQRPEAAILLDAYLDAQQERAQEAARAAGGQLADLLTGAPVAHGD